MERFGCIRQWASADSFPADTGLGTPCHPGLEHHAVTYEWQVRLSAWEQLLLLLSFLHYKLVLNGHNIRSYCGSENECLMYISSIPSLLPFPFLLMPESLRSTHESYSYSAVFCIFVTQTSTVHAEQELLFSRSSKGFLFFFLWRSRASNKLYHTLTFVRTDFRVHLQYLHPER